MKRILPMALLALASGCATLEDQNRAQLETQQDMEILVEKINKLQGRIEGIEIEQQRIRQQLEAVPRSSAAQVESLQARVSELDSRIQAVNAARERDKQDIIDKLSGKIAQVVSSSSSSKAATKSNKKSASGEGYEHVVESGQSISAIAQAYGVRTSDIITANDLKDPNHLKVGQKLFIPSP